MRKAIAVSSAVFMLAGAAGAAARPPAKSPNEPGSAAKCPKDYDGSGGTAGGSKFIPIGC